MFRCNERVGFRPAGSHRRLRNVFDDLHAEHRGQYLSSVSSKRVYRDGKEHEQRHHEYDDIIFAGGYVALAKGDPQFSGTSRNGVACNTFNQTSPTSGGGPSGCTILYTISYKNLMPNPAQVSGETGDTCVDPTSQTTVPCTAQAGMAIADDGTIAASNWAQYTNGIAAAATDVPLGTGSFVYYNGAIGAPGNGTTYGTQCSSATPCKALKYVITNTIAPQQSGSFSFSATIH